MDRSGNIYVVDSGNHTIRRITRSGTVTTFAGLAGTFGDANGSGGAARFFGPQGLAVDSIGNVYVADSGNSAIRKITPAGVVSLYAGVSRLAGAVDGPALSARFWGPARLAVDASGNIYVSDAENQTIRKISSSGMVSTLAGSPGSLGSVDGLGSAARFSRPQGIAVDSNGIVYVADYANHSIRRISTSGVVTTLAGNLTGPRGHVDAVAGTLENTWQPVALTRSTPAKTLDVAWRTTRDPRPRALTPRRFLMPFAQPGARDLAPRPITEIAGADWHVGRALFSGQAACATCHQLRGEEQRVGPELGSLVHRDYASVLADLADPKELFAVAVCVV